MKIRSLDRVALLVKDMDKAVEFFSEKFGIKMSEMSSPNNSTGTRVSLNLDNKLELISLEPPVDNAAPFIKRAAKFFEDSNRQSMLLALVFKVEDLDEAVSDAEQKGMRVEERIGPMDTQLGPVSIRNFEEAIFFEEDALGVTMALAEYERS